jgi:hypothetical protein
VIFSTLQDSYVLVQNVDNQPSGIQFKRENIDAFGGIFLDSRVSLPISEKKAYPNSPIVTSIRMPLTFQIRIR